MEPRDVDEIFGIYIRYSEAIRSGSVEDARDLLRDEAGYEGDAQRKGDVKRYLIGLVSEGERRGLRDIIGFLDSSAWDRLG